MACRDCGIDRHASTAEAVRCTIDHKGNAYAVAELLRFTPEDAIPGIIAEAMSLPTQGGDTPGKVDG